MTTRKRLIPKIEIKNGYVVKGIELEGVQKIGNPLDLAVKFYSQGCDEIILSDVVASLYNRIEIHNIIEELRSNVFVPICAGGGVSSIETASKLFESGADKIFANSSFVNNPVLIEKLATKFGSSSVVCQIDTAIYKGGYKIFTKTGREFHNIDLTEWVKICINSGAGELMITSIRYDGKVGGPDFQLLERIANFTSVPVLYSGGINSVDSVEKVMSFDNISGACISSALYKKIINLDMLIPELLSRKVDVRRI